MGLTQERFLSIDVLRGLGLAGVLMMNIQAMGMPAAAYFNPTVAGGGATASLLYWSFTHIFVESKFLGLFSMLFGASILIVRERWSEENFLLRYELRMLLLFLVGAINAYFIWYGDILLPYALCGAWLVLLHGRRARTLIAVGIGLYLVPFLLALFLGAVLATQSVESTAEFRDAWSPSAAALAREIAAYQGSWIDQMSQRIADASFMQSYFLLTDYIWRVSGLMLIGMGLFKLGILQGSRSTDFYRRIAYVSFGVGLPIAALGAALHLLAGFRFEYSMMLIPQLNYLSAPVITLGYVALAILWVRSGFGTWLRSAIAHAGQISLTNYLLHGIVGSLLFYGLGLGLFGTLPRWAFLFVFLAIWAAELVFSQAYRARYRRGPVEALFAHLIHVRAQRRTEGSAFS